MQATAVTMWQCSRCATRHLFERDAEACCVCRYCNKADPQYSLSASRTCLRCWSRRREERIVNVPLSLYDQDELAKSEDTEYGTADSFDEVCEWRECDKGCDASHGVYGISPCEFKLDAEGIIENVSGEWFEGALEDVDVEDLQRRLDEWCKEQGVRGWHIESGISVLPDDVCRRWVDALEAGMRGICRAEAT